MGFPTPFPEPDSPELQRFAVRSRSEIVGRLRALEKAAVPLNVFVGADASFGVVTLRRVDETAGEVAFERTADEGLHDRLLSAPLATFVGYDDEGKVQFAAAPRPGPEGRSDEFTTLMPEHLFRLQRRTAVRLRFENVKTAVCRIPVPGGEGEWEALRVLDISTGGIALLTYPERFEPMAGAEIDDCRLDLPGVGGVVVSIRMRHDGPRSVEQKARCCGCEFVRMASNVQPILARYLKDLVGPDLAAD